MTVSSIGQTFAWPIDALSLGKRPVISDHFDRIGAGGHRIHLGVDIMFPRDAAGEHKPPEWSKRFYMLHGTIVRAVGPGKVWAVDRLDRHGIAVTIDHGMTPDGPRVSVYRHLATATVQRGQLVGGRAIIGTAGADPSQGGRGLIHLHFEWWDTARPRGDGQGARDAFAIDPAQLLARVPVRGLDGKDRPPDLVSGAGASFDPGEDTSASGAGAVDVLLDLAVIPGGL